MIDFYFGSFFVKLFPFDDVFLGIVAKKLAIEPFHASGLTTLLFIQKFL